MFTDAPLFMPTSALAEPQSSSNAARRPRDANGLRLYVYPADSADRGQVESFIRGIYWAHYRARIRTLAPVLVALCAGSRIVAAAGYRAATQPLFLERYLPAAVEQCVHDACGAMPQRERIVEVGHLASVRNGAGRMLMPFLGAHLVAKGFEWVVSTATAELHSLFCRLGLAPLVLGAADPAVLGTDATDWGSYYDHQPQVLAGSIVEGMARLTQDRR